MRTVVCLFAALIVVATPALAADRRDPFAPHVVDDGAVCTAGPGVMCASLDSLTLRGVVVGVASPRALFEDAAGKSLVLKVGDVVGGWRIAALRRGAVVFAPLRALDRSGARVADVVVALD